MRKGSVFILLLILLGCISNASAKNIVPDDFAYGMTLETDRNGFLYKLKLGEEIYRTVTKSDLSDLIVFNQSGDIVPFVTQQPQKKTVRVSKTQKLPFFPVYAASDKIADALSLAIKTDKTGKIITYETSHQDPKEVVQAYVIDASGLDHKARQLRLEWSAVADSFIVPVTIEHSDDLTNWQTLVNKSTVVSLHYDHYTLAQNTIDIPSPHKKYLKMSWSQAKQGSFLKSVDASFEHQKNGAKVLNWIKINDRMNVDGLFFEYDSGGVFPVSDINLASPQPNTVLHAVVKSRPTVDQEWRTRHAGLFYNLAVDGTTLKNNTVHIPPARDRYWRVELEPVNAGIGTGLLTLLLGWDADELFFIAQGEPPFTLAFGNIATDSGPRKSAARLFNQFRNLQKSLPVKAAQTGPKTKLGGEEKLLPQTPPLPWKVWLLWATLVASVFVLGLMSWRLYKQMNPSAP